MISTYTILVTLHVLFSVLSIGAITGVFGVLANVQDDAQALAAVRAITTRVSIGLVAMLVTGIGAEGLIHFADEPKLWFRGGFLLLLAIGGVNGYLGATTRKALASGALAGVRSKVRLAAGLSAALISAVVTLMVLKP